MKNEVTCKKPTDFMTLAVFALLAFCILAVLVTGAGVYNRLTEAGSTGFDSRTLRSYLTTRVRQADARDQLSLAEFGGSPALVLREGLEGETYLTRIYCHDGYLRELFTPETGTFSPEDGEKLLPLQSFHILRQDDLLVLELSFPNGVRRELILFLRSEGGVLP